MNHAFNGASLILEQTARRTGKFNHTCEDERRRWLLIWCAGAVTEYFEFKAENAADELGDLLWYSEAIRILMGWEAPPGSYPVYSTLDKDYLVSAATLLEHAKKLCRDGKARAVSLDMETAWAVCRQHLDCMCNRNEAVLSVHSKLMLRYPDGFSADKSINRCE